MAKYSSTIRMGVMAVLLMSALISLCQLGRANDVAGGNGSSGSSSSSSSSNNKSSNKHSDPAQIVAKAMQCFNNRTVYRNCDEDMRLNESGSLRVENMEAYCRGACFTETNLVLNCLQGIMTNFKFHNNATINDVKDTFKATCTSTSTTATPDDDAPSSSSTSTSTVLEASTPYKNLQASQTTALNAATWSLYVITCVVASQLAINHW